MRLETLTAARHTIVEQLALFLRIRRRTWTGLQTLLEEGHLSRPAFSLLRALEGETIKGQALTLPCMRAQLFNPYATRLAIFEQLPRLVEQGYLQPQGAGYLVTEAGCVFVNRVEVAARTYIGTLQTSPALELTALARALVALVHRSWRSPEPLIKAHQARTQRRLPAVGAAALVQIEWAILGLWEARDDAHMAAWRSYDFSGPVFDILSPIWSKEAHTLPDLLALLGASQWPTDIQRGLQELTMSGYILSIEDHFALTPRGQEIRDAIERETDRVFFAPWQQVAANDVTWLAEQISKLCTFFAELAEK